MKLNDIRSNLFSDSLPSIFAPLYRQSVARARSVIVPSIKDMIALKHQHLLMGEVADLHSQAVGKAVLKRKEVPGPC